MDLSVLHLNIEGHKHIEAVRDLIKERNPEVVCLAEARLDDVDALSKYPILETQKHYYNETGVENLHVYTTKEMKPEKNERLQNRFEFSYNLLTSKLKLSEDKVITIATTHFPVTDHTTLGLKDHELGSLQTVDDEAKEITCMDRLIKIIRQITGPIIFTSDLNNPRGEYLYDLLAHELVDHVPSSLTSSIDPNLHRQKGLELMIDTIMTSPDLSVKSFEVIEGVSDHKAFLASLKV